MCLYLNSGVCNLKSLSYTFEWLSFNRWILLGQTYNCHMEADPRLLEAYYYTSIQIHGTNSLQSINCKFKILYHMQLLLLV